MYLKKRRRHGASAKYRAEIESYISRYYSSDVGFTASMPLEAAAPAPLEKQSTEPQAAARPGAAMPLPQEAPQAQAPADFAPETSTAAPDSAPYCAQALPDDLSGYLRRVRDESFAQMLFRKIDEKGMKDAECYKKANIDKRLFSKIRSNAQYKPSKSTALALIIALELPYEEACEMLMKAGFAFSHASKADLIVEYYIMQGIYDLFVINESLYDFDQPLLGNVG